MIPNDTYKSLVEGALRKPWRGGRYIVMPYTDSTKVAKHYHITR